MAGTRSAVRPPDRVAELFGQAVAMQRQGRHRDAATGFAAVLAADPHHFGALCSAALLCWQQGSAGAALPLIDRALRVRPDAADARQLRACILQTLGRAAEAIAAYQAALQLRPDLAEAASNLGGLYAEQGQHEEARCAYEQALASRPDFAEAHNNLGVTLLALDQAASALMQFDRAVQLRPEFADAQANRGSTLVTLGRIDEAADAFEAAIRLSPRTGRYYRDLVGCRRLTEDHPHLVAMQALAQATDLPAAERIELLFALAKALADLGRPAESFRQLRQGNALKRVGLAYDEAAALETMRRIATLFDAAFLAPTVPSARDGGGAVSVPVFVVGMPRSGTTLVEQILASHTLVFGAGERPELHRAAMRAAGDDSPPARLFDILAALPDDRLRQLGASYAQEVGRLAPWAARIVDKMPGNFLLLGVIARALPRARIVHVRRDPLDTCLSCFATLFASEQPYAYNLAELGRYCRGYDALMRHWRAVLPPGMMLDVRYEDVVDDIEGQARRMVAHCGLAWDDRCLKFHETERNVQTASRVQVRQGLYRSSVGRAAAFGDMLAPLRQALGDVAG